MQRAEGDADCGGGSDVSLDRTNGIEAEGLLGLTAFPDPDDLHDASLVFVECDSQSGESQRGTGVIDIAKQ